MAQSFSAHHSKDSYFIRLVKTGELTSALIDDMQAFTVMNQHQLSNDGNSLILIILRLQSPNDV